MLTWLLLVSLLCKSTQEGNGPENGVSHCGPQKLMLSGSDQTVLLTWEDDHSCSGVHDMLVYELLVLIADKEVYYEEVAVMSNQIGSTHSWNWTSHLALECASHSVWLRARYQNHTSPWKQEKIAVIENTGTQIYPKDRLLKVGSKVTFCCVLPAGDVFKNMYLMGYDESNMNATRISNRTYALTVLLNRPSEFSCTRVICDASGGQGVVCAYIGYAPRDRDLQCETRNLQSVECHWTVGEDTRISYKTETVYHLLGRQCDSRSPGRCTMPVQVEAGERNWTLTAQNYLGKVELYDWADLTKRVHMFAPVGLTASNVNARNVTLEWGKVQQDSNLSIRCQVNVSHGETETIREYTGVGLHIVVLNDLIPHWMYNVTVRCGTTHHFWKWSDWSTSTSFLTQSDVPNALDVWMHVEANQTVIIWKTPLANQSHGHILDYEVTWMKTTEKKQQRAKVHNQHRHALSLNPAEEYIITVTARNMNGSSAPSTITVPSINPETVKTSRIIGTNGSFSLSWSASTTASCGYIVDWCPNSEHHKVGWLKVPPNETSASIFSKNFKDGVRYLLSVYACTQGAPVLLQRWEGYVREERIENNLFKSLRVEQQHTNVVVSWDTINLKQQSAFIQGYNLYCLGDNNKVLYTVSTENSEATNLTVTNVKITTYTLKVNAKTAVGECGTTTISTTLSSPTDNLLMVVSISLVAAFCLLSTITILCYRHWTCIKETAYPPVPKPVFTDKWLTASGENICQPLRVDQCYGTEENVIDVSELQCNSVTLENGYVSQKNMLFIFAQTPKGYYNQPLKKCIPTPFTLPAALPSQSGFTSSPFTSVFSNPSYEMAIQTEHHLQSNTDPELQTGSTLERSSSGYQPQSETELSPVNQTAEAPDSPMSCVSTYILLPQSE